MNNERLFDVIVIGAGHAGCEAALACSRLGAQVGVVTLRRQGIAQMSCNPAIGGVGKGHLVREIDALGGAMAEVADATGIQFRRLNSSRGAAVQSTRVQSDSRRYRETMAAKLQQAPGTAVIEGEVVDLLRDGNGIVGVTLADQTVLRARAVVLTTGTFLRGRCHTGQRSSAGGRIGDRAAGPLSGALGRLGLTLRRFKTGTPPRLCVDSIDFSGLEVQPGDLPAPMFAFGATGPVLPQIACHITYTSPATHAIVAAHLDASPLSTGAITGLGPRYCPSLEDKVSRFADKSRHQVFLEPEELGGQRIYPAGISCSLPEPAQEALLRTIAGLERVRVLNYGYAVEYDSAPPTQLWPSLMTKVCPGLFLAGQINGTSGYEEAAAQGLMGGLNAVRFLGGLPPAVLGRDEAYIGVMIDDLVTRGVDEPYRIFTSRAEHRLTLRESTAEARLTARATAWGLLTPKRQEAAERRQAARRALWAALKAPVGAALADRLGLPRAEVAGLSRQELLRRPHIALDQLVEPTAETAPVAEEVAEAARYAGYIAREQQLIARLQTLETIALPPDLPYRGLPGLTHEVAEKLAAAQPVNLGQASRLPGMTPAALAVIRARVTRQKARLAG